MNEKNVLVIDDSATIRRLVDKELTAAGYRVLLAPTAEEGLALAEEKKPDLIILDHQLPGTTGYEVACKLLENPATAVLPVVASSTLRKKAYSEYVDCDNVVDMMPKPYTPEVLVATVENAIETGAMIVGSQNNGAAVPEVIDEQGESDLSGKLGCFSLREIVDMLTNGCKKGVLQVDTPEFRVFIYTNEGRIQGVTASGIKPDTIIDQIPESLSELAPVVKVTATGKRGNEIDGMLDLLNNKLLDARLLQRVLRMQAAIILRMCFTSNPTSYRFDLDRTAPTLFERLPLNISLLALLVDGATNCDESELPKYESNVGFVRRAIRGQNLDRTGLASEHMQLMKYLNEPMGIEEISSRLKVSTTEATQVIHGFEMAELIEKKVVSSKSKAFFVTTDGDYRQKMTQEMADLDAELEFSAVSDLFALGLLLRKEKPSSIVVDISKTFDEEKIRKFWEGRKDDLTETAFVAITGEDQSVEADQLNECGFATQVSKSMTAKELVEELNKSSVSSS